jgi:hypothetical protein
MSDGALSYLPYDDVRIGAVGSPLTVDVDAALAARLAAPIGECRPVERMPVGVLPVLFLRAVRASLGGIPSGAILAKQTLRVEHLVDVPAVLTVTTVVAEKIVKRGRPFVRFTFSVRDSSGTLVATGDKTMVWPSGPGGGR